MIDNKLDKIISKLDELEHKLPEKKSNQWKTIIITSILTALLTFLIFLAQRYYNNSDVFKNEANKKYAELFIAQKKEHIDRCKITISTIDSAFETYCVERGTDDLLKSWILDKIIELNRLLDLQPQFGSVNGLMARYSEFLVDEMEKTQISGIGNLSQVYEISKRSKDSCINALESNLSTFIQN